MTSLMRAFRMVLAAVAMLALLGSLLASPAAAKGKDAPGKPDHAGEQGQGTTGQGRGEPRTAKADTNPDTSGDSSYSAADSLGSMYNVVDQIGARSLWLQGITGAGIDVAIIDTGVAPVPALSGDDKVVAMVDLSFEAGVPEAVYLDTYGHGTHMAGIIAGRDPGADPVTSSARPEEFIGVAPDAGIVSVKVADNTGATDVSQVIAAIDWVVQHRNTDGLNIRVLNVSYSTDGTQDYRLDPLARAVENAWNHGIVVVVAGGNDGWMSHDGLSNPAYDPFVISVGAAEATDRGFDVPMWASTGDFSTGTGRDKAHYWQSGYEGRLLDLVAPGAHIDSLRAPGSRVDSEHPEGYVTETVFRGSGSSQAAAVTSGAVALLLQARPHLTPDEVKALLTDTADAIPRYDELSVGNGLLDLDAALLADVPADAVQTHEPSTGLGSLEEARGTQHVTIGGELLTGETTFMGAEWDAEAWVEASTAGASWTGASWTGASWTGASWTGASWTGASWTGASWTGASWTGATWTGATWTGASWTGASWTGASWTGASWTGASWTGASWTGASWTGASWTGASWTGASWTGASWTGASWTAATWT